MFLQILKTVKVKKSGKHIQISLSKSNNTKTILIKKLHQNGEAFFCAKFSRKNSTLLG
ncbi:hypothetical protein HMPREF3209_02021 [Lactobacillus crispatus]|nr:hypothetical protein HMPREF3209_02021 [Lactobacillus crispatus]